MHNGIHFISGLPRAGSTLFSAILRQNPRFHASVSSGVTALVLNALTEMSQASESNAFYHEERRLNVLRGMFEGYYHDVHRRRTVFDTNRIWCSKLALLDKLYPKAKVICCVRDLSWVYDSIEALIQRNPTELSRIFAFEAAGTVYDRFEHVARGNGLVGFAYNALRQACFGPHADKLLLLTYETLTSDPARAMQEVYAFLGMKPFQHDFANIAFDVDVEAFDRYLGTPGLHSVGGSISPRARRSVLPPDLFARAANDAFWRDPARRPEGLRIV